jgi:TolB-like protein
MRKLVLLGCILFCWLILAGCGSKTSAKVFTRQDVDYSFIERIAVMPFENNSGDRYAAVRARNVTITQVLELGLYDTVEKILVDNVLYEEGVQGSAFDPLTLKRIGQRLLVQAVLLGNVDHVGGNIMALTLRLVEVNSGLILWQTSGRTSTESFSRDLVGVRGDDSYMVTLKLVRKLLQKAPAGYF